MPKAETPPALPEGYVPFHFEDGELPDVPESVGDRIGQFTSEIGAHQDAADAQPSAADLHARGKHEPPTEAEKARIREAAEKAKRELWPEQYS